MAVQESLPAGHRYQLERWLGAGGYSEVWRARDTLLDRPVAIKLLHAGYAANTEAVMRFEAEARHAGSLAHENIARVYDYGEPGPQCPPFLVMELVDGPSLAGKLADGPLTVAQTLDVICQTATGLAAAHRAGLIHRDIKPANLLLSPAGTLKITDFGISHAIGSAPVTSTGMIIGTIGYLAPERAAGAPATPASDLYALGVVGHECLAGAPPFTGSPLEQALAHRDLPLPALPAQVPEAVAALIGGLTAKDPAMRLASAADVANRAGQLRDGLATGLAMPGTFQASSSPGDGATQALTVPPGMNLGHGWPPLSGAPVSGAPVSGPQARRSPRWPLRRAAIAAVCALAGVAGLTLASLNAPWTGDSVRTPPPAAPSGKAGAAHAVLAVNVDGAALIGEKVSRVADELRQQGLAVRIRWQRTGGQKPGTVLAIQPAGRRPRGSLVTIIGARRPAPSAPGGDGHGHQHGHGNATDGAGNAQGDDLA